VKIAFVGKGGSGKTTLTALFTRYLAESGHPVVAIDADINQNLAAALGLSPEEEERLRPLGAHLDEVKETLRGDNPRIPSAAAMVKTTPPGRGSRLVRPGVDDPVADAFGYPAAGATLMVTGPFQEDDLGVACYHSKVGAAELYLNHSVDTAQDYIVVDMTAGADSFASGLFTRFDITFLVAEPTLRGVGVYRQYTDYARDHGVHIRAVGNKVTGSDDADFLHEHLGDALEACLGHSEFVRSMEKGRSPAWETLEPDNLKALGRLRDAVDATGQDWDRFMRQAVDIHLRNADRAGDPARTAELAAQVDQDFAIRP
jgi:CO dehydrogenase maturation factor